MKRFIKNPIILSLILVLAGTLSAGTLYGQLQQKEENSATDTSPYGYQEMVFNDGTGQFEGWTLEKDNNLFIYTHSIPASDGNIGLLAWALSHGSSEYNPSALMSLKSVEVKKSNQDNWQQLTVENPDLVFSSPSITMIPKGYTDIRITCSKAPDAITIGALIRNDEPTYINGDTLNYTILKGEKTTSGIKAVSVGEDKVGAEIYADCNSAATLTQAISNIHYAVVGKYQLEDEFVDQFDCEEERVNINVTAITTDNSEIVIPFSKGSYFFLPAHTKGLRIKWTIDTYDPLFLLEEQGFTTAFYVIDNEYDYESRTTNFVEFIHQRADKVNETKDIDLPLDPSLWYDIDGDGIKEFGYYTSLYRLAADFNSCNILNSNFPDITSWVNLGRGSIGFYGSNNLYRMEDYNAILINESPKPLKLIDYNNDGITDFLIENPVYGTTAPDYVLTIAPDGNPIFDRLTTITPEEYYNYIKEKPSSGLGSGVSFVGGGDKTIESGSFGVSSTIDINNDGYLDFIYAESGQYLLNLSDGRYMADTFGGKVLFRDFDGDGITDMLTYNSETQSISISLQRYNGKPVVKELFKGLKCSSQIWCRDFDNDGDIDILVPFNGSDNGGQSYLVMFENTGNGSFKKHENYIEGNHDFHICTDLDADGTYEIIYFNYSEGNRNIYQLKVNGTKYISAPQLVYEGNYKNSYNTAPIAADIDGSGIIRIIFNDDVITLSETPNQRPERPSAPYVIYDAATGEATISWNKGSDKETAASDLTYELRIGTAPGLDDLVSADALEDGTRRNLLPGNCGYTLQRRLNTSSWPQGNIYISVQAIDTEGQGSPFSECAVFKKAQAGAAFAVILPDNATVGDTISLRIMAPASSNAVWDLDGATIISQSADEMRIVYSTPGEKLVTLTAGDGANKGTYTRNFTLEPSRLLITTNDEGGLPMYDICLALDMDLDGKVELVSRTYKYNGAAFYEGDENGIYTPVKRLFNTNVPDYFSSQTKAVDINRDGLPDIAAGRCLFLNEGDKSMNYEIYSEDKQPLIDLDNDGVYDTHKYRNTGNYIDYEYKEIPDGLFVDFNGDGLVDIIGVETKKIIFYANKGNFEFEETKRIENSEIPIRARGLIGDFDSDGNPDYIWTTAGSAFGVSWQSSHTYVLWSDGSITKIPAPSGHLFDQVSQIFDFDNNGYQDVLVANSFIIYFHPDRKYEVRTVNKNTSRLESVAYKRTDGKIGLGHALLSCKNNTPPTAPTGVHFSQNSEAITIKWNRATDAETPAPALRYNISIKRVGVEGEEAYFMSPLNGGLNGVAVPSNTPLQSSTLLTIPLNVIASGEYEVKIQAVDTQWLQGDFSETVTFNVVANAAVDIPTETMVGATVNVRINAGFQLSDIHFDSDCEIEQALGNSINVHWNTAGLKTVTAGEFNAQIYVHPKLDASFNLPQDVYEGDKIRLDCDTSHPELWEVSTGILEQHIYFKPIQELDNGAVTFSVINDRTAEISFNSVSQGTWNLRHTITEPYGSDSYRAAAKVSKHPQAPGISLVDIDAASGKYHLNWQVPAHLEQIASAVNIYKETAKNGEYRLITTLPVSETDYIDNESSPSIVANRYALSYSLPYGETAMSAPHKPIHVMINKGIANSWNLIWNKYDGCEITTYNILRGSSAASLEYIAEVSGNITSYSDFDAPEGENFYAIEIVLNEPKAVRSRANSTSNLVSRSNIVSTSEANSVILSSAISIESETGSLSIDGSETSLLQLFAVINPSNTSLKRVDWAIERGSDIVSINELGTITALANGTAIIRAYATDGSGVYGEATVTVSKITGVESVVASENKKLNVTVHDGGIEINGIQADETNPSTVRIYNTSGILLSHTTTNSHSLTINARLTPGVYIVSAIGRKGRQSARFIMR